MRPVIEEITDISVIAALAADAGADGHPFVSRAIAEWRDGTNRFAARGEHLYGITRGEELVAVGGLNLDPYTEDPDVGRVRRFYVAKAHRRAGIGTILLGRIADDARDNFTVLRLRTRDTDAASFYEANGFSEVTDDEFCTHKLELG